MTYQQILDVINQNIKQNGNEEITGDIMNSVLRMLLDFVNQGFITFSDIIQLLADSKAINVVGSINTTTNTTSLPSGVYHTQTSGTYTNASGIVVKEGYYTLLRKKDDGSWVLESEVKMPMHDLISPQWKAGTYKEGALVYNNGLNWRAKVQTTQELTPNATEWECVNFKYDNDTNILNLVDSEGNIYAYVDERGYFYFKNSQLDDLDKLDGLAKIITLNDNTNILNLIDSEGNIYAYVDERGYFYFKNSQLDDLDKLDGLAKIITLNDNTNILNLIDSDGNVYANVDEYGVFNIEKLNINNLVDKKGGLVSYDTFKEFSKENSIDLGDKFEFPKPNKLIYLDFKTESQLPTSKGSVVNGEILCNINDVNFKKYATLEVQGSSSAFYPKKNWTIKFFNNQDLSDEFEFRLNNSIYQNAWVFKANYIDFTQSRNVVGNRLWEDIVQSRNTFPIREVETPYQGVKGYENTDTGAWGHVDGFPAVLSVNGSFYGIGTLNMGKKRDNYNLKKSNKKHIQLNASDHADFLKFIPGNWELINPNLKDYKDGGVISDTDVMNSINRLWEFHNLSDSDFKANFDNYYDKVNMVDFYLLINFLVADDCYDKNLQLTTWDSLKWFILPYDLDTIFGLHWSGASLAYPSNTPLFDKAIWGKVKTAFDSEIKLRYKELRDNGIFDAKYIYDKFKELEVIFGQDMFKKENNKWVNIPSKDITSVQQVVEWTTERIEFLDTQFNYNK